VFWCLKKEKRLCRPRIHSNEKKNQRSLPADRSPADFIAVDEGRRTFTAKVAKASHMICLLLTDHLITNHFFMGLTAEQRGSPPDGSPTTL
jgi:hypothetical protein